ncbi:PEGA domain-containing protein [Candidatus Woesearchaeota archaeon]|nr:PEGA domain-containing protein [Candidatus Woesearchaeota archaeon]
MISKNTLNALIFFTLFAIIIVGCSELTNKTPIITEKTEEEITDTGVLIIDSFPTAAQVYINTEFKGDTPLALYNFPVGSYNVVIKKEGYTDFEKNVAVTVGRTEEIDAALTPIKSTIEEIKPEEIKDAMPEDISALTPKISKINISTFAMYYDFDKMEFTELRTEGSDLFSRKYDNYIHFTALTPAKINVINKPIYEVNKEDCIFSDIGVASVFSGQTLCVMTLEGATVAIGGIWQESPAELKWALFS